MKNINELNLSVVMVSDFEPSHSKSWKDEMSLIKALSCQDIDEPFEVILVESEQYRSQSVPTCFYNYFPSLKVHYYDSIKSSILKDFGVELASGKYIAVLESDCIPSKNWLKLLLEALIENDWGTASGLTYYGNETSYQRIMNLLHRSWDDHGKSCETSSISNNGAIYKREILENFKYPDSVTPFISAQMRNKNIRQEGYRFYFERNATMKHKIGGWSFVWDYQRNKGHQKMSSYAGHYKYLAIVKLIILKLKRNINSCMRLGKVYLSVHDWLLLPFFMLAELIPYTVGMLDAINNVESIPKSAYR